MLRLIVLLTVLALFTPAADAQRVWPLSEEGYKTDSAALGSAGRAHESIAAWDEGQGERVVSRVVGPDGRPLSVERELAAAGEDERVGGPAAAGRRAGYLVAWGRSPGVIEAAAIERNGEPVGAVRTIAEDALSLRVVYQPRKREYLVVWLERDGESLDATEALFARRLDRSGEPLGPAVTVSPRHANVMSYAVAARPNRRGYLVAWNRSGPEGVAVEARALSGRAEPASPVRVIAPGYNQASVALAWSGRERTFVLATHDYRVKLYRVDPDGTRRGRSHTVKPGPTVEQSPFVVVLAYERRSDTLLVVWQESDDLRRDPGVLQARRVEAATFETRTTPRVPWRSSSTFYDLCCSAVVAFRGRGYLVAWAGERGDGTGSKIFAQGI